MKNDEVLGQYLLKIGRLSLQFRYTEVEINTNLAHFQKCHEDGVRAYDALLLLEGWEND